MNLLSLSSTLFQAQVCWVAVIIYYFIEVKLIKWSSELNIPDWIPSQSHSAEQKQESVLDTGWEKSQSGFVDSRFTLINPSL